jgi:hypothetical protein
MEKRKQVLLIISKLPAPQNCRDFLFRRKLLSSCQRDHMDTFLFPCQCLAEALIEAYELNSSEEKEEND